MKLWHSILILGLLPLLNCTDVFLTSSRIATLSYSETGENQYIFYEQRFTKDDNDRLYLRTHSIYKVADNLKTKPEVVYVFDGSIEKLTHYNVRLIHANGSKKNFNKSKLQRFALSNSQRISTRSALVLPIQEEIKSGDLVEMVSVHEMKLPFLGIQFSPQSIGDAATNIACIIEIPPDESLTYKVYNDSITPRISKTEQSKSYEFKWDSYIPLSERHLFDKKNNAPIILAQPIHDNQSSPAFIKSWNDFGNYYLDLIQPKIRLNEAVELATTITKDKNTAKEKMDAIVAYCQKEIRYEQVYLEKGEIIPNDYATIIFRKYGDCKDYSFAIYTLARSIGLEADLALCYRGRGIKFFPEIPVSQFNHMIVSFKDNGENYWYDGTNRSGPPGVVDRSLLNQTALVLKKGGAYLETIAESPQNNLIIEGELTEADNGLKGDLSFTLCSQYAIDFFFADFFYNQKNLTDGITRWLTTNINEHLVIKQLHWQQDGSNFQIKVSCILPNTVISIEPHKYISLSAIFKELFPMNVSNFDEKQLFYYPHYNRVAIDLKLNNLFRLSGQTMSPGDGAYHLSYNFHLPSGPFSEQDRKDFIEKYNTVRIEFSNQVKLIRKDSL